MAIYTHKMINWGKRIGNAGPRWAHLIADTAEELHAFAQSVELRRKWHQGPPKSDTAHYDIGTERIFQLALQRGAQICDTKTYVGHQKRIRQLAKESPEAWR